MPMFGVPDWVAKAVVIVAAVTFVPVLIFAWAFEMTPEGIKREKDVDRSSSITSETGKKLDYVTIAAVIAGVAFLGFAKLSPDTKYSEPVSEIVASSGAPSVAVLPFVNMSGNAENEYFSDGLTETLLHMLAQVPELKVAARTSSFAFKGQEQDIRKIALALGVAHVLEGSVQRSGDKVRVTAQLIRADDGFHVWSSIYDRTLNDIFAIQDEIATDVGKSLTTSLLGEEEVTIQGIDTHDVVAYDLYLQALERRATHSYGGLKDAEELLKDALILDPDFVNAKILLALVYDLQQGTGLLDPAAARAYTSEIINQILSERPDHVMANAMAVSNGAFEAVDSGAYRAFADAIPALEELVDKAPNDTEVRSLFGYFLIMAGRPADALYQYEQVLINDPVNAVVYNDIGMANLRMKMWEAAGASFERSIALNPDQPVTHDFLGTAKFSLGDVIGGMQSLLRAMEIDSKDPEYTAWMAGYLYAFGLIDEGDVFRARTALIAPNNESTRLANLYQAVALGDVALADQLARSMVEDNIAERWGTYVDAVCFVVRNAQQNEDATGGLAFIEHHQPGFNDPTSDTISIKVRKAQSCAFSAWYATRTSEDAAQMVTDYWRVVELAGLSVVDFSIGYLEVLAIRGDTDEAIDYALSSIVNMPISRAIRWRERFDEPYLSGVASDPRVSARLQQWDEDVITVRAQIKEFLASQQ
jgi:TolB-like protein/Flp pilus assembly protein TadD